MNNKRYLLTGASSGIGEAMARQLSAKGYALALAARRTEKLQELAAELGRTATSKIAVLALDVTDYPACQAAVEEARARLGGLDGVIANAGIGLYGSAGGGYFERFQHTLETNLIGAIACLDAGAALFRQQGHGHLVAMASVAGRRGLPRTAGYSASKAGLISYVESLQAEFYRTPAIVASVLLPGYISTPINEGIKARPFEIGVEKGATLLVKHVEARSRRAYVPAWPWALLGRALPCLPTALLAPRKQGS